MWEQDPRFLLESLKNIIVIDVPCFAPRISLCVLQNKCSKPKSAKIGHFLDAFSRFALEMSVVLCCVWWNCVGAELWSAGFLVKCCGLRLGDLVFLRHSGWTMDGGWSKGSFFLRAHSKLEILIHLNCCFSFKIFNSLPFECWKPEFNISFSYRVM